MPDTDRERRLAYAIAKFDEALYVLATASGAIKQRLAGAHLCVGPVTVDDVPEFLRSRVDALLKSRELVMSPRRLRAMKTEDAVRLATEFYGVERALKQSVGLTFRETWQPLR